MNKGLIALRPILYEGRQFHTGEQLPSYDEEMVNAWIENGSAKFETDTKEPETDNEEEEVKADEESEADEQEKTVEEPEEPKKRRVTRK